MNRPTDQPFDVLRIVCEWRLSSQDTGGQYCALKITVPPECVVPLHQHKEQEAFFMLEGTLEFAQFEDGTLQWKALGTGQVTNIPSNAVHGFRNTSGKAAQCLLTAHAGMENFFVEVGTPLPGLPAPPTQEEVERLVFIATKHGHRFLSPEATT